MKKPIKKKPEADTEAVRAVLLALIHGYGHGGLTYVSAKLGMTPSALRKRLLRPGGGFDGATMRALALVMESKADTFLTAPEQTTDVEGYRITLRRTGGGLVPAWEALGEQQP